MKILQFLSHSAVSPAFRDAVETFLADGRPSDRVAFTAGAPTIKVERTLAKVLEHFPELPIERVAIEGRSGCSTFAGHVTVETALDERRIDFEWDCRWKAEQMGWTDYFGFADQTRAAREFGHDCFREWEEGETPRVRDATEPVPR